MLLLSGSVRVASVAITTTAGAASHPVAQVAPSPLLLRRRTIATRVHHFEFAGYGFLRENTRVLFVAGVGVGRLCGGLVCGMRKSLGSTV